MEFTMQTSGFPVGTYRAEFLGAEPYRENLEKYGEGVSLKWRVLEGEHTGDEVSRICSAKLTPKTALGKLAVALKGSGIQTGERYSFATYIGVRGALLVEPTDGGGSRVTAFLRDAPSTIPQLQPLAQSAQQAAETF